jgi:signal transduction histidine kinase
MNLLGGAGVSDMTDKTVGDKWPTIERRTPGWAIDWQSTVERDKAALARILHDNTGGLLVAAVMDINWAQSNLNRDSKVVKERLDRARDALDVAISLNRRMIEDLRPTLLDTFGLVAALKWHFSEACKTAEISCEEHFPDPAPNFAPQAAIALYRSAQTLIAMMVGHRAHALKMGLNVNRGLVVLNVSGEGMPDEFTRELGSATDALASVTGRIRAVGGDMEFTSRPGGADITCRLPSDKALRA